MPYDHLITGLPFLKVEAVKYGYPIRVQCSMDQAAVRGGPKKLDNELSYIL